MIDVRCGLVDIFLAKLQAECELTFLVGLTDNSVMD